MHEARLIAHACSHGANRLTGSFCFSAFGSFEEDAQFSIATGFRRCHGWPYAYNELPRRFAPWRKKTLRDWRIAGQGKR